MALHKSTFSKLKLWTMSIVSVISLALVIQLTTQSASAAAASVQLSDANDVVEIFAPDEAFTLVTDFAAIQRDHTVNRSDAEVDHIFNELNSRMADLGWDLTSEAERNRLEIEAERVRELLAIHNDTLTGGRTGTDMQKLEKVLETTFSSSTCEGRCLSTPGEKATRTIIFAAIAAAGTLGLAATGVIGIPAAVVALVVAAVVTTAQVYFAARDDVAAMDNGANALQRQMANNAIFAGIEIAVRNYDAARDAARADEDATINEFLNNLSEDVAETSREAGATPDEIGDVNDFDMSDIV